MATSTPWGMSQHSDKIAVGIMKYVTASHGGVRLSKKRNEQVPDYMRDESGWYEEDDQWTIVACVFPDEYMAYYEPYCPDIIEIAKRTLLNYMPDMYERFFNEEIKQGESTIRDQENFYKEHANDYIVISAIGEGDIVKCVATKGGHRDFSQARNFIVPIDEYRDRNRCGFVIDKAKHLSVNEF